MPVREALLLAPALALGGGPAAKTARRTLQGSSVRAIEESRRLTEKPDWKGAAAMLEVSTAIRPQPFSLLGLARTWMRAGDQKRARRALGAGSGVGGESAAIGFAGQ